MILVALIQFWEGEGEGGEGEGGEEEGKRGEGEGKGGERERVGSIVVCRIGKRWGGRGMW